MPFRRAASILTLMGVCYMGLAWAGWVPGGWRLRNLFEPHQVRETRRQAEHRQQRLDLFRGETIVGDHPVVFFGSSTIERMPLGRLAPTDSTVNRGVAFESGRELLERLSIGIPPQPGGIVLYMTSIDHRFGGASPEQIRDLGASIIDRATLLWPSAPIAVLALLPEVSMEKSRVEALKEANANLGELCRIRSIPFITVDTSPLTLADGSLDPNLSSDPLHLNNAGYDHLWRAIKMKSGPLGEALGR